MHSDGATITLLHRHHRRHTKSPSRQHKIPNIRLGKKLGTGSFSEVFHGVDVKEKREVAVKVVDTSKMTPQVRQNLQNEIEVMKAIRGVEGTVQLYDVVYSETSPLVFLVMELAKENLMEYLLKRKRAFSEDEARDLFVQLAKTLETLHQRNIVHRDIKLENIYISCEMNQESWKAKKKSPKLLLKIGDFGFATFVIPGKKLDQYCGTPIYAAPEIVSGTPYDGKKVDVWSLGVVLYAILCGRFPFTVNKPTETDAEFYRLLFDKIQNKKLRFSHKVALSAEVKDLLSRMLDKNPITRLTMKQVLTHPWVQNRPLCIQAVADKETKKRVSSLRSVLLHSPLCTKNHSFDNEQQSKHKHQLRLSASGILLVTRHQRHNALAKQVISNRTQTPQKESNCSSQTKHNTEPKRVVPLKTHQETDR